MSFVGWMARVTSRLCLDGMSLKMDPDNSGNKLEKKRAAVQMQCIVDLVIGRASCGWGVMWEGAGRYCTSGEARTARLVT